MNIFISDKTKNKLTDKHDLKFEDIKECFCNLEGEFLTDTREEHKTDPITQWFIAENNRGQLIKVCFMQQTNGDLYIKTAYEPNEIEIKIYNKFGLTK